MSDTFSYIDQALQNHKKILYEGAQGILLDLDYGTYPYVTSSNCSVQGLAKGAGLTDRDVNLTLGLVKAFFMTRVGGGPFPTELGGIQSESWCNASERTREDEERP